MRALLYLAVLIQLFFSGNNHLPSWYWFQEISINFGAYWLVLHILTAALLILFFKRLNFAAVCVSVLLLALFSASYLYQLRGFLFSSPPAQLNASLNKLRIVLLDAQMEGRGTGELKELIATQSPAILGVIGLDAPTAADLKFSGKFAHHKEVLQEGGFGVALYSNFPFEPTIQTSIGEGLPPIISTQVQLSTDKSLNVLLINAPSPYEDFLRYRLLVRRTSTPLRQTQGPLLVFGNFNATEFSGSYRRFKNAGRLQDAMAGYGYFRTWNTQQPLSRLTVDHILYRELAPLKFERLADVGSTHYPILADFAW